MARKNRKVLAFVAVAFLLNGSVANAETASELYSLYDKDYTESYPTDTLKIINDYRNAQRYSSMYHYVVNSEYDSSIVDSMLKDLRSDKTDLCNKLLSGYNMKLSDIYQLESDYQLVEKRLLELTESNKCVDVVYNPPTPDNSPTHDEYVAALNSKELQDARSDIGKIGLPYPVAGAAMLDKSANDELVLIVSKGSLVKSLFNGEVARVDEKGVTINHHNDIYTFYGDLTTASVQEGDTVYQGQPIGNSGDKLTLRMKLGGEKVDISKIFTEEIEK